MSIPFCEKILNNFCEGNFMDNVIDKIREICEQKNISVSKMEKDLGFGNGYLNPKKVNDIKMRRLFAILTFWKINFRQNANCNLLSKRKGQGYFSLSSFLFFVIYFVILCG